MIDSLSFVPTESMIKFLVSLMARNTTVIATYHMTLPHSMQSSPTNNPYYPSALSLLSYFSTTTLTVTSLDIADLENHEKELNKFLLPLLCNKPKFGVSLSHRRRSGRAINADFIVDSENHSIEYVLKKAEETAEDESLLKNFTTFNLSTTEKQREAKENVELPYLVSQDYSQAGTEGGAIIYEFEKDDDYDEEDPYEDPF